jgi:hypothetical protein
MKGPAGHARQLAGGCVLSPTQGICRQRHRAENANMARQNRREFLKGSLAVAGAAVAIGGTKASGKVIVAPLLIEMGTIFSVATRGLVRQTQRR